MESLRFTKMHGAGNDYIYINGIEDCPANLSELAVKMSDRHKGVGGDGLIVILPSAVADFKMRMFNSDGTEGEMCGNASACIGKYVYEKGLTNKKIISLETLSGIKILSLSTDRGFVTSVTVDMDQPVLQPEKIPVSSDKEILDHAVETSLGQLRITAVSTGNPHGVVFVENVDNINIRVIGRELEIHPLFPRKANIEFVEVLNPRELKMRIWERGSGETQACGTGSCAAVVAGVLTGQCNRDITIHSNGGTLHIKWDERDNHLYMSGETVFVFEGEYLIEP